MKYRKIELKERDLMKTLFGSISYKFVSACKQFTTRTFSTGYQVQNLYNQKDLKCQNIFLGKEDNIKIGDLGISQQSSTF